MRRTLFLTATLSLPLLCVAQMPSSLSQQDMQELMGAMQEMQACYQQIDQKEITALQQQSQQFVSDIQTLCNSGKRSDAQSKAISYSKQMMQSKVVKQLEGCAKKMPESLKSMAATAPVDLSDFEDVADGHVCDAGNLMP